ncbi:MAG: hypothetical protein A2430_01980, partial [Candidatus Liptonbacteria bacterium RIFOXYC1_FULL_36_8]
GAGPMATAYAKVLINLKKPFLVVGRGKSSARLFTKTTNHPVILGGLDKWLKNNQPPKNSIIAVNIESLGYSARLLLKHDTKRILIEKPGGLNFNDIKKTAALAKEKNATVFLGYNRRFLSSVLYAKQLVKDDGGLLSIFFDFTEQSSKVASSFHPPAVKHFWLLANSSHVIDLAFFLAGKPKFFRSFSLGRLLWHKPAAWSGSGLTKKNVIFSCRADWRSPSRWRLELYTKKRRLILEPLEEIKEQLPDSFAVNPLTINNSLDLNFKPGLYLEVKEFLRSRPRSLLSISDYLLSLPFYKNLYKTR